MAQIARRVARHHDIRLIEMLPKDRPNRACGCSDSGKAIWQGVNVAYMTVELYPNMPCGREQIVLLLQIRFPNSK